MSTAHPATPFSVRARPHTNTHSVGWGRAIRRIAPPHLCVLSQMPWKVGRRPSAFAPAYQCAPKRADWNAARRYIRPTRRIWTEIRQNNSEQFKNARESDQTMIHPARTIRLFSAAPAPGRTPSARGRSGAQKGFAICLHVLRESPPPRRRRRAPRRALADRVEGAANGFGPADL
jgi:hypothetical protein